MQAGFDAGSTKNERGPLQSPSRACRPRRRGQIWAWLCPGAGSTAWGLQAGKLCSKAALLGMPKCPAVRLASASVYPFPCPGPPRTLRPRPACAASTAPAAPTLACHRDKLPLFERSAFSFVTVWRQGLRGKLPRLYACKWPLDLREASYACEELRDGDVEAGRAGVEPRFLTPALQCLSLGASLLTGCAQAVPGVKGCNLSMPLLAVMPQHPSCFCRVRISWWEWHQVMPLPHLPCARPATLSLSLLQVVFQKPLAIVKGLGALAVQVVKALPALRVRTRPAVGPSLFPCSGLSPPCCSTNLEAFVRGWL